MPISLEFKSFHWRPASVAPFGRLSRVLIFSFDEDKVTLIDVIGDRSRMREMQIVPL